MNVNKLQTKQSNNIIYVYSLYVYLLMSFFNTKLIKFLIKCIYINRKCAIIIDTIIYENNFLNLLNYFYNNK